MVSKYEDCVSVVGKENAHLCDYLDKADRQTRKADYGEQLVMKSYAADPVLGYIFNLVRAENKSQTDQHVQDVFSEFQDLIEMCDYEASEAAKEPGDYRTRCLKAAAEFRPLRKWLTENNLWGPKTEAWFKDGLNRVSQRIEEMMTMNFIDEIHLAEHIAYDIACRSLIGPLW